MTLWCWQSCLLTWFFKAIAANKNATTAPANVQSMFGPLFPIEWVVGNFLGAKFDFETFACFFLIGMIGVVILLEVCSMIDIGVVDGIDSTRSGSCKLGRVSMTGDISLGES